MERELLSPKSDLIFRMIFGNSKNTDILADFLQAILKLPADEYSHLTIVDPHLQIDAIDDKMGILDVKVHTKSGKVIDVEVQLSNIPEMRERIIFYASRMITEQIGKGEYYKAIKQVISIVITDYVFIPENENYHNVYHFHDENTKSTFSDVIEIHSLELPKLPDKPEEKKLWNWMAFLKADRKEEFEMLTQKEPKIERAYGVLKELSADEQTRLLYESREKARMDYESRMAGALKQGAEQKIIEIVKSACDMKMSIENIAALTKLSIDEVKEILGGDRS